MTPEQLREIALHIGNETGIVNGMIFDNIFKREDVVVNYAELLFAEFQKLQDSHETDIVDSWQDKVRAMAAQLAKSDCEVTHLRNERDQLAARVEELEREQRITVAAYKSIERTCGLIITERDELAAKLKLLEEQEPQFVYVTLSLNGEQLYKKNPNYAAPAAAPANTGRISGVELLVGRNPDGYTGTTRHFGWAKVGGTWMALDVAAPAIPDAEVLRLIETIKYVVGIAERGEGRTMRDDETVEQFVLGYVNKLEATFSVQAMEITYGTGSWGGDIPPWTEEDKSRLAAALKVVAAQGAKP